MSNEHNSVAARDIPVPPGGGSWTFNEAQWKWISNDPAPVAADDAANVQPITTTTTDEQEQ